MGSFNIGEIFAALKLDDTEFIKAVERAGGASRLLGLEIKAQGQNWTKLLTELHDAGYQFQGVSRWMQDMMRQGWKADQALRMFNNTLQQTQARTRALTQVSGPTAPSWLMQDIERGASKRRQELVWGDILFQERMFQETRKSTTEAAKEHDRAVKARRKAEEQAAREKSGLIKKLEKEEQQSQARLLKDKLIAIEANRKYYERFDQERRKKDQDYANLVRQLSRQETQSREKATRDWLRMRDREEREQEQAIIEAERLRRHLEHERYFQYRAMSSGAFALGSLGAGMAAMGAIPIAGLGAAAKIFADFDEGLTRSLSIMENVTEYQRKDMVEAARELAKETGISAEKLANTYYFLESAGLRVSESISQLPVVARFSVAANTDLERSTELLTSAMSALGMESRDLIRISDALVKADMIAKGSAIQFAEALAGKGGGALRIVNKGLEEGVAMLATYAKVGIVSANAQEALNQVLRDFARVTIKDKAVELNGEIFKFGQIVYDAHGKMRPFWEILGDLEKRMEGMTDLQKRQFFVQLGFQDRSVKATTSILGLSGAMKEYYDQIKLAGGATREVAEKQLDTFNKQLALLQNRAKDVGLVFGGPVVSGLLRTIEVLDPLIQKVEEVASGFERMPEGFKTFATAGTGAAGLAGIITGGTAVAGSGLLMGAASLKFLVGEEALARYVTNLRNATTGMTRFGGTLFGMTQMVDKGAVAVSGLGTAIGSLGLIAGTAVAGGLLLFKVLGDMKRRADELKLSLGDVREELLDMMADVQARDARGTFVSPIERAAIDQAMEAAMRENFESAKVRARYLQEQLDSISDQATEREILKAHNHKAELEKVMSFINRYQSFLRSRGKDIDRLSTDLTYKIDLSKYGLGGETTGGVDVDTPDTGRKSDPWNVLGLTNYNNKLKELRSALNQVKGSLTDWQMKQALAAISRLEAERDFGPDFERRFFEDLDRFNRQMEENAKLIERSLNLESQWQSSQADLAILFSRTHQELQKIADVEVEGGLADRLSPELFGRFKEQMELERLMSGMGSASQATLNIQMQQARDHYNRVVDLVGDTSWEARVAWVNMVEAQARATHDKTLLMSRDYLRVKKSIEDVSKTARVELRNTQRQISTIITDFSANLFDIMWPKEYTGGKDKLSEVTSMLRDAFEKLVSAGYSDPKRALEEVITQIRTAATLNEANAVAIRHFGDNGVLLAKMLRDGSLSAGELSESLSRATKSLTEFEQASEKKLDRVNELWRQLTKAIFRALVEDFATSISEHVRLWDRLSGVWSKVGGWLGIGGKAAAGTTDVWSSAPDIVKQLPGAPAPTAPSAPGKAGGVGTILGSGLTGTLNTIFSGVSMVAGIGSFITAMRQEGTLNAVEKETRYSQIHLMSMLDLQNRFLPSMENIAQYNWNVQAPALAEMIFELQDMKSRITGSGGGMVIHGDIHLHEVNDPDAFVRELKARKAI